MSIYGLTKLNHGLAKKYAMRDWRKAASIAEARGRADLTANPPTPKLSTRKIDARIEAILDALNLEWSDLH